jgi:hypothetical protein
MKAGCEHRVPLSAPATALPEARVYLHLPPWRYPCTVKETKRVTWHPAPQPQPRLPGRRYRQPLGGARSLSCSIAARQRGGIERTGVRCSARRTRRSRSDRMRFGSLQERTWQGRRRDLQHFVANGTAVSCVPRCLVRNMISAFLASKPSEGAWTSSLAAS